MTQRAPIREVAWDGRSVVPSDASNRPTQIIEPYADPASDNDVSERVAREKLKKTSIASISQHAMSKQDMPTGLQGAESKADDGLVATPDTTCKDADQEMERSKPNVDASRGRPVRKRSFDDLEAADAEANRREALEKREEIANGHARKRSRDVRAGELFKEDGRSRGITVAVEEEAEDVSTEKESHKPMNKDIEEPEDVRDTLIGKVSHEAMDKDVQEPEAKNVTINKDLHEPMDKDSQEPESLGDTVIGKMSHESMDNDTQEPEVEEFMFDKEAHDAMDRDSQPVQKGVIQDMNTPPGSNTEKDGHLKEATTNSSSEGTGTETSDHEMRDSTASPRKKRSRDQFDPDIDREQKIAATAETRAHRRSDEIQRGDNPIVGDEDPLKTQSNIYNAQKKLGEVEDGFKASNVETEPKKVPATFGSTSIPTAVGTHTENDFTTKPSTSTKSDQLPPTSASAFASSGFAQLSNSATSPFGALGVTSAAFSTPTSFATASPFSPKKDDSNPSRMTGSTSNGGFSAFAKPQTSGFGAKEPSPFGSTGVVKTGVFGGSIFGGGFGGGFAGGGKLTNFAAPTGDTKLRNGAIKSIGSPTHDGDDEDSSESDGEGFGENGRGDLNDEADERFQHQDGKLSFRHRQAYTRAN